MPPGPASYTYRTTYSRFRGRALPPARPASVPLGTARHDEAESEAATDGEFGQCLATALGRVEGWQTVRGHDQCIGYIGNGSGEGPIVTEPNDEQWRTTYMDQLQPGYHANVSRPGAPERRMPRTRLRRGKSPRLPAFSGGARGIPARGRQRRSAWC